MALLKAKDIIKMSAQEKAEKLKFLRLELIRANVRSNKTNAKTKEIKKAISRILTHNKFNKPFKRGQLKKE